jgi:hypothetical protein
MVLRRMALSPTFLTCGNGLLWAGDNLGSSGLSHDALDNVPDPGSARVQKLRKDSVNVYRWEIIGVDSAAGAAPGILPVLGHTLSLLSSTRAVAFISWESPPTRVVPRLPSRHGIF